MHLSPYEGHVHCTAPWCQARHTHLVTESTKPARKGSTVVGLLSQRRKLNLKDMRCVLRSRRGVKHFISHQPEQPLGPCLPRKPRALWSWASHLPPPLLCSPVPPPTSISMQSHGPRFWSPAGFQFCFCQRENTWFLGWGSSSPEREGGQ